MKLQTQCNAHPWLGSLAGRLAAALVATLLAAVTTAAGPQKCSTDYDVCVIGAGGAGAFAAIKLKQLGHRVLVLEREDRVGGHCETWTEPTSGFKIDTGVVMYCDIPLVVQTFRQFNVTLVPYNPAEAAMQPVYTVSPAGQWLGAVPPTDPVAFQNAFGLLLQLMTTRFAFIETANGEMPHFDSLPAETIKMLASPFGKLLDSLEQEFGTGTFAPLQQVFAGLLNIGPGNVQEIPALIALRTLRPAILKIFIGQGYTVQGGCSTLYDKFHDYLGDAVKLSVQPFTIKRKAKSVDVTYTQGRKTVRSSCRRLVVSAVQSLANLQSFIKDLDAKEKAVFSQVTHNIFSKAIVRTPPTPGTGVAGVGVKLDQFGLRDLPATVGLGTYGPLGVGLTWTVGTSPKATVAGVKDLIFSNLTRWAAASGGVFKVPASKNDLFVDGPDLHEHTPRPADMSRLPAFYKSLYALQGYRNTYYTGALLSHNAQYDVWRYSDWLVRNTTWTC